MCWVIPPASPATTSVERMRSSRSVLPWSTWPITVTTGGRGRWSASSSSSSSSKYRASNSASCSSPGSTRRTSAPISAAKSSIMSSLSDCVAMTISPWSNKKRTMSPALRFSFGPEVTRRRPTFDDDLALGHRCGRGLVGGQLGRLELFEVAPTPSGPPLGRAPSRYATTATGGRCTTRAAARGVRRSRRPHHRVGCRNCCSRAHRGHRSDGRRRARDVHPCAPGSPLPPGRLAGAVGRRPPMPGGGGIGRPLGPTGGRRRWWRDGLATRTHGRVRRPLGGAEHRGPRGPSRVPRGAAVAGGAAAAGVSGSAAGAGAAGAGAGAAGAVAFLAGGAVLTGSATVEGAAAAGAEAAAAAAGRLVAGAAGRVAAGAAAARAGAGAAGVDRLLIRRGSRVLSAGASAAAGAAFLAAAFLAAAFLAAGASSGWTSRRRPSASALRRTRSA